jgi:hypothetical protein
MFLVTVHSSSSSYFAIHQVPVPNQESERSCICVSGVCFYDFSVGLLNCSHSMVFFVFHLIRNIRTYVWYTVACPWSVVLSVYSGFFLDEVYSRNASCTLISIYTYLLLNKVSVTVYTKQIDLI